MKKLSFLLPLLVACATFLHAQDAEETVPLNFAEGDVIVHTGKTVTLNCPMGILPTPGDSVEVSKYFEEPFLGGTMTGWLSVADATVSTVKGSNVTIVVHKEKSDITVNDKKVDHFKLDNHMKLGWKKPQADEE